MKLIPRGQVDFIIDHPGSVLALCLDSDHYKALMVHVPREEGASKLELPGGVIKPDETPNDAVLREAREEAGFVANSSTHIFSLTTSAGITNEIVHVFQCEGHIVGSGEFPVSWVGLEEVSSLLTRGQINAATTVATLFYVRAQLNRTFQ